MKLSLSVVLMLNILLLSVSAFASNRTVCFQIAFNDDRLSCPAPGTTGARFTCAPTNGWSTAMGATVQLWDKDPVGGDDFIGYFVTGRSPGLSSCITFDWEASSASSDGESNPDLFLRYTYEASGQANGNFAQARDGSNNLLPTLTWRNGTSSAPDQYVAVDCAIGSSCWINGGGILIPNSSGNSIETIAMAAVDAAGFAMAPWVAVEDQSPTRLIRLRIDDSLCSTGCVYSDEFMDLTWAKANQPEVVMHELGHLYHRRAWANELEGPNYTYMDPGGGWNQFTEEHEEATFIEGWATYFAAVGYYNPNATTVTPMFGLYNIESNQYGGQFGSCASGFRRIGNVIRSLWDLDDWINEPAHATNPNGVADDTSVSSTSLYLVLESFLSGTTNRRREESDVDGPNMRDYLTVGGFTTSQRLTALEHNCLEDQDDF